MPDTGAEVKGHFCAPSVSPRWLLCEVGDVLVREIAQSSFGLWKKSTREIRWEFSDVFFFFFFA